MRSGALDELKHSMGYTLRFMLSALALTLLALVATEHIKLKKARLLLDLIETLDAADRAGLREALSLPTDGGTKPEPERKF